MADKEALYSADLSGATWVKSERSGTEGQQCVEVADITHNGAVIGKAVRDSKDPSRSPLCYTLDEWAAFTGGIGDKQQNLL